VPFGGLFPRPPPDGSPVRLGQLGLFWSTLWLYMMFSDR
jgi:hypothetical protein